MDKSLLMYSGGIRSAVKTLSDGKEHTLYFKAKTPQEITLFLGAERRYADDDKGDLQRERKRAEFVATSMCDEGGALLMTADEAMNIPATLKPELCQMIVSASNEPGEAGKG